MFQKPLSPRGRREKAAAATRAYTTALARAGESDTLRAGLNLGKGPIRAVGTEKQRHVKLTFKDDKTLEGTLVDEDADWITVESGAETVGVRKADVTRISRTEAKKSVQPRGAGKSSPCRVICLVDRSGRNCPSRVRRSRKSAGASAISWSRW